MLTVDIGNSNIKWAVWQSGRIVQRGCCGFAGLESGQAFSVWRDIQPQRRVIVSCVAGSAAEQALARWVQQHWSVQPEILRSSAQLLGVSNAYSDPAQFGDDRWAALLGAHSQYDDPVCIIDAGTAITVDLLGADGVHRGGRILPGLSMMREALLEGAAGIENTEGDPVLFATNTADAVSSGTLHMLRAALIEVVESARRCLGNSMKIIITGGMSGLIMSLPELPEMIHEPDLVLIGLHASARQRRQGQ